METIRFNDLDEHSASILPHNQAKRWGINDLKTRGLLWNGESEPVENLWKSTSTSPSRPTSEVIPFNVPEIDQSLLFGGLSCGALHEFYYKDPSNNAQTAIALPAILARNTINAYYASPSSAWDKQSSGAPPFFIAWIGKRCWPTPFSIPQHLLSSCLFIDPPNSTLMLWAIETALRSQLIKLVIADCPRIPLITTRRLSIRAHASGATALLIRSLKDLSMPSSSATKWSLAPLPSSHPHPLWTLTLERNKGGSLSSSSWTISLESTYEDRETLSLRILPRVVDTGHTERSYAQRFG